MDFHGLSRKDLQGLCKKNKIPANMTNVAMADALAALEMVEGLDDVLNQPMSEPQQSPPRTACRSSRRKLVMAEPFSSRTLTRTRHAPRRSVAEEAEPTEVADQKNVGANLLGTPAVPSGVRRRHAVSVRKKTEVALVESQEEIMVVEEKKNMLETPAVKGSIRRCVAAGSRSNAEKSVYSTRRSVRLLEKTMEVLSLKEENTEILEDDGCCNETEEVEEKKNARGIDTNVMSVQSSRNDSDTELCQNLTKSLEDASETRPELDELSGMEVGEDSVEKSSLPDEQVSEEVSVELELGEENKGIESESDDASEQEEIAYKNCEAIQEVEEEMHQVQEDESDDTEELVDVSVLEADNFDIPCLRKTPAPANQVSISCPSGVAAEQTLSDVYVTLAEEFIVAPIPASPMEKLPAAKCSSPYSKSPFPADTIQGQFPRPPGSGTRNPSVKKQKLPVAKCSSPYSKSPFPADTIQGQFPRPPGSGTRNPSVKKQIKPEMADDVVNTVIDKENFTEETKEGKKGEFNEMSLRQLKKMFKDKSIAKKNTEEENGIKVENNNNKRVALQALPDN